MSHPFLLQPGVWLGEGTITFTASPEALHFASKWEVNEKTNGQIRAIQQVELRGVGDKIVNHFLFSDITPTNFTVELQNDLIGTATGKGIYDEVQIGWEFLRHADFQGFEMYRIAGAQQYSLHAEFCSSEEYRSIIQGHLWKKAAI